MWLGSSPLAWGKSSRRPSMSCALRFIPTRVGKITVGVPSGGGHGVHPHSRGENYQALEPAATSGGSSPLAWGKSVFSTAGSGRGGFIPTRVGKIACLPGSRPVPEVHPHSRGENTLLSSRIGRLRGSSPLAWGKWHGICSRPRQGGFIPTRVGKITFPRCFRLWVRVHPHSRGENRSSRSNAMTAKGSSPLAWGKSPL